MKRLNGPLPSLRTSGQILVMVRCKIDSGVHIFALCYGVLKGILVILIAWLIISVAIEYGSEQFWNSEEKQGSMDELTWWKFKIGRWIFWGLGIVCGIFTITHIERTIRWYDLVLLRHFSPRPINSFRHRHYSSDLWIFGGVESWTTTEDSPEQ